MSARGDGSPEERLARWTAVDAAIGSAAEVEQLRARLAERDAEASDLTARLAHLTSRVAQLEAEAADLRRSAQRMPVRSLVGRVYRKARSVAANRLR